MRVNDFMRDEKQETAPGGTSDFINTTVFLQRVPVSRRTLSNWRREGKIPFVNVGGRRVLFHWPSVEQALLRAQRNCI